jgi:hypothetical protein
MSLTSELRKKGEFYNFVLNHIDIGKANILIRDHADKLCRLYYPPLPGTNYPLVGMSIVYAVRDYLGKGLDWWKDTAAAYIMDYPDIEGPAKYVLMALADKEARKIEANRYIYKSLLPSYKESIQDVAQIVESFDTILPQVELPFIANPMWVKADANLLMGETLWDIRTTKSNLPLSLDNILQQVGYLVINKGKYNITSMGIYYSRQCCYFEYPLNHVLKEGINHQLIGE